MTRNRVIKQMMVVSQDAMDGRHDYEETALFGTDGAPVSITAFTGTGATIPLTGYAGHAAGNLGATDKVNEAFGKLEARLATAEALLITHTSEIADHETRVDDLETLTGSHTTELADHESRLDVLEA